MKILSTERTATRGRRPARPCGAKVLCFFLSRKKFFLKKENQKTFAPFG
jgi:hypothetical protein